MQVFVRKPVSKKWQGGHFLRAFRGLPALRRAVLRTPCGPLQSLPCCQLLRDSFTKRHRSLCLSKGRGCKDTSFRLAQRTVLCWRLLAGFFMVTQINLSRRWSLASRAIELLRNSRIFIACINQFWGVGRKLRLLSEFPSETRGIAC